ncbi:MAG: right-handed parallel beta-helix repeat-containing protein [Hominilimicola sp.]
MDKIKKLLVSISAAIMIIGAANVFAYSDDAFSEIEINPADGFYTVITDTEGDEHTFDGVINAKSIETSNAAEKIASYAIYSGNEEIISTKLNDIVSKDTITLFIEAGTPIVNGYYSVKFTLSEEDNTEVFLTGLSDSNLDMVQEKLISAKLENLPFTMESLDFIDAEKTNMPNDGDNELCWAATTSNMLHYTGWGEKAGFNSTDDLFDLFRDSFTDVPGNGLYGFEWFFNGTYQPQTWDDWAHVKDYGNSGGYLKEYSSERVARDVAIGQDPQKISDMADALENGNGVGIVLGWVDVNGNRNGGHVITAWGYICDKDFSENDTEYYKSIIISDSDSDEQTDTNRRTAPNKLNVLGMSPFIKGTYNTFRFDDYGGVLEWFLDNNFLLNVCSEQDSVYVVPKFENTAAIDFDGILNYTVTITDKSNNSEIISKSGTYTGKINAYENSDVSKAETIEIGKLPAGKYTVAVTVNPEKTVTEAYYYNNTETYDFSVSDKSYDVTGVTFNVSVGDFTYDMADVTLEYTGLDTVLNTMYEDLPPDNSDVMFLLAESYYNDGKWSSWSIADTSEELPAGSVSLMSASVPEKCRVYANGEKVKFRLIIEAADESIPLVNISSDEQDLKYTKLSIAADETNTGTYTKLGRGATSLAEGETFAFKVKNASTYDSGDITCNVTAYAKNDNDRIELFRKDNIFLSYGESDTLSFNSWTTDNLSGKYEIITVTECDCAYTDILLGTIYVEEPPSFIVTTSSDTEDKYDGVISLREAVSYIKEYGGTEDEIIFEDDVNYVFLSKPLTIDTDVKITGNFNEKLESYTTIYGSEKTQQFNVTESGALECESLTLNKGYSKDYGGAVENNGGSVYLKNCIIKSNKSGAAGGAIYSDGGSVKLLNCTFEENISCYGGAIGLSGNAKLDMLNCSVFGNSSNIGAVYNNSGTATIIYSTFTNNAALSSGGGAITSPCKTNVVGSIATLNGDTDLDGNVNVYGSYITNVADNAALIEKSATYDNILTGVNVYNVNLGIGTNVIDLKNINTGDSITTYMLWSCLESMNPLCSSYTN